VGPKGRTGHRWWVRGERPRGLRQQGYEWAHLFGAVRPATGEGFALVLPEVSTAAMQAFLDHFAAAVAPDAHAGKVQGPAPGIEGRRRAPAALARAAGEPMSRATLAWSPRTRLGFVTGSRPARGGF
jgi:hypothetical protein